ncbi:hypothetical protein H0H87_008591 [Tephrocybe sp. NHM501043]|nr:hypothetical protein H0H87_008591 [Tephrocybe sp. NHM501043]
MASDDKIVIEYEQHLVSKFTDANGGSTLNLLTGSTASASAASGTILALSKAANPLLQPHSTLSVQRNPAAAMFTFILAPALPILLKIPNKRNDIFKAISDSAGAIADDLLERARAEKAANVAESQADKSIIGTLSAF